MVSAIFGGITSSVSGMISCLGGALEGVVSLVFYENALTDFGVLMLIGVGVGLTYGVFRFIRSLATPRV